MLILLARAHSALLAVALLTPRGYRVCHRLEVELPAASRPGTPALYLRLGGAVGAVHWDSVRLLANSSAI